MKSSILIAAISAPSIVSAAPNTADILAPALGPSTTPTSTYAGAPTPDPLPDETDGVLSDGTVINSPNWPGPSGPPIFDGSNVYNSSGPCTAYITQSGFGSPAQYQAWFRDASNTPIGGMPATSIKGETVSITVGGGTFTIAAIADDAVFDVPAKVQMTWQSWPGWNVPMLNMLYNPDIPFLVTTQCTWNGNAGPAGTVSYFSCAFACGPEGWPL